MWLQVASHYFLSMWLTTELLQTTCGINSSLEHCLHCLVITINLENHQQIVSDIVVATLPSWSAASAGYEHAMAKSRGNNSNKSDLKKRRNESNKDKPLLTETNYFQLLWFYFWTGIIKESFCWQHNPNVAVLSKQFYRNIQMLQAVHETIASSVHNNMEMLPTTKRKWIFFFGNASFAI